RRYGPDVPVDDTSAEARSRRRQIAAWRSMSETDKLLAFRHLCASVDSLARVGILLDHPAATENDVLRHLATRRFGSELAEAAFGAG
ncbi:MAG TPA: hypothetical protein VGE43_15735, partial [Acidimicrobiales bacterium]